MNFSRWAASFGNPKFYMHGKSIQVSTPAFLGYALLDDPFRQSRLVCPFLPTVMGTKSGWFSESFRVRLMETVLITLSTAFICIVGG